MEPKKFINHPNCTLCRGKRKINYKNYIEIECPACNFEDWTEHSTVNVRFDLIQAKKIRQGIIKIKRATRYVHWKNAEDEAEEREAEEKRIKKEEFEKIERYKILRAKGIIRKSKEEERLKKEEAKELQRILEGKPIKKRRRIKCRIKRQTIF